MVCCLGVNPPRKYAHLEQNQPTPAQVQIHGGAMNATGGIIWCTGGISGWFSLHRFSGFIYLLPRLEIEAIVDHLKGKIDPAHDFSAYLDETSMTQLAYFLKNGLIDNAEYIDPVSLRVVNPDIAHGQELYSSTCLSCHGEDGKAIVLQIEGINEYLGSVANRDPWRFLHRTRFGVAGTDMPVGLRLGWTTEDGRDVLAYAQSMPTGGVINSIQILSQRLPSIGPASN
jgi:thiosulfate dehydrogenase